MPVRWSIPADLLNPLRGGGIVSEMLRVTGVHKRFRGLHALNDVSLALSSGKIWSMIGPNGAGKTTLLNIIAGALRADSGRVEFMGKDVTNRPSFVMCRLGIARTYQHKNLFPNLTVADNITAGMLKDAAGESTRRERLEQIVSFLGLAGRERTVVSDLSPLDSKLVELGRALATNPMLILLDELLGGLLPPETERICAIIEALRTRGQTIFQIGHEMGPIMKVSDWIFVLSEGRKVAEGTPEEIRENQLVHDVYLD